MAFNVGVAVTLRQRAHVDEPWEGFGDRDQVGPGAGPRRHRDGSGHGARCAHRDARRVDAGRKACDRGFADPEAAYSVWEPARSKMFPRRVDLKPNDPRQPKLLQLRRHDLRHAACSWWLREGVDAVVCQRWSGHRTLRCSSTSTRAWRPAEGTRVSSGWSGAWPDRHRCHWTRVRRVRVGARGLGTLVPTAPARPTMRRTSRVAPGCLRCAGGSTAGTTVLPGPTTCRTSNWTRRGQRRSLGC